MTPYQQAKELYKTDKPAIRQEINEHVYFLAWNLNLSEHEKNLLSNYACKLHPKQ